MQDYRIIARRHLAPFFAGKRIDAIEPDLVAAYMQTKKNDGLATKTVANHLSLLHAIFRHAVRRGWAHDTQSRLSTGRAAAVPTPTYAHSAQRKSRR